MIYVPFQNLALINRLVSDGLQLAYTRVMTKGQYILDTEVALFEKEWAEYCGMKFAVGTGNALDALTLMLRACEIGPGHEVIVPSNTYIATWLAVSAVGAIPVPVEPNPNTHNIDAALVQRAITSQTKAILAVHLYGRPASMIALKSIALRNGIPLLIDAAQAHGLKGSDLGDAAAFSFYPTKNLGALGDGGAVVTNDAGIANRVRVGRNYGSTTKNVHKLLGINSRLDELQAAFLREKLPLLNKFNSRRRINAKKYGGDVENNHVWHQFVLRVNDRDEYRRTLAAKGIETLVHYPTPPHLQDAYKYLGYGRGSFPIAEQLAEEVVSLPIGPELTNEQVAYVADVAMEYA